MNILKWLFRPHVWMPRTETADHWRDLERLGYEMKSQTAAMPGLRDYWITDNNVRVTETMHNLTVDEAFLARRVYANAEWQELEQK